MHFYKNLNDKIIEMKYTNETDNNVEETFNVRNFLSISEKNAIIEEVLNKTFAISSGSPNASYLAVDAVLSILFVQYICTEFEMIKGEDDNIDIDKSYAKIVNEYNFINNYNSQTENRLFYELKDYIYSQIDFERQKIAALYAYNNEASDALNSIVLTASAIMDLIDTFKSGEALKNIDVDRITDIVKAMSNSTPVTAKTNKPKTTKSKSKAQVKKEVPAIEVTTNTNIEENN